MVQQKLSQKLKTERSRRLARITRLKISIEIGGIDTHASFGVLQRKSDTEIAEPREEVAMAQSKSSYT